MEETIVIVVYIFILSALAAIFFGKIEAKIDNILEEIKKMKNNGHE